LVEAALGCPRATSITWRLSTPTSAAYSVRPVEGQGIVRALRGESGKRLSGNPFGQGGRPAIVRIAIERQACLTFDIPIQEIGVKEAAGPAQA